MNPADELVGQIGDEEVQHLAAVVHIGGVVVTLDKINTKIRLTSAILNGFS